MRITVLLLLAGCYSTYGSEPDPIEWSPDAGSSDWCNPRPRVLSTREILSETYHVTRANCEGRISELTLRFRGPITAGRVEIVEAIPEYAPHLEARPVDPSRLSCSIDASSRFVVSPRGGLELEMRCTDGVTRTGTLTLFDDCGGVRAEVEVSEPEEWTHGCYGADWSRR